MVRLIYIFFILLFTQGCVNTAVSGAQALYNREDIQNSLNDRYVVMKADRSIYLDTGKYQNTRVSVACFNGVVLLAGQVNNRRQAVEIEHIAKNISGVTEVHNLMTVSASASALTDFSDMWITTKIKSKFLAAKDVNLNQIKVVTDNGTVYLMGIVPHKQANAAVYLARTTDGVQRVVKIFSYLQISKT